MAEHWVYTYTPVAEGRDIDELRVAQVGPEAIARLLTVHDDRFDVGLVGLPAATASVTLDVTACPSSASAPLLLRWRPAEPAQQFSGFSGVVQLRAHPEGWVDLGIVGMCSLGPRLDEPERVLATTNLLLRRIARGLARTLRDDLARAGGPVAVPALRLLRVGDVMSRQPLVLTAGMDLRTAARRLLEHGCSAAPVTGAGDRLEGVVSVTDLMPHTLTANNEPAGVGTAEGTERTVGTVMSRPALTTTPQTALRDAITVLRDRDIGRLIVVEHDRIVGVISRHDALKALARWAEVVQHAVDECIAPFGTCIAGNVQPDGTVVLTGHATSQRQIRALRASVLAIEGVVSVEELIVVRDLPQPDAGAVRQHAPRHPRRPRRMTSPGS